MGRENWGDPSGSESSTQLNSSSGSWLGLTNDLVEFPLLGSNDLIRLGEDLLQVYPVYRQKWKSYTRGDEYLSWISTVISTGKATPTGLSSEEATGLMEVFRKVLFPATYTLSV